MASAALSILLASGAVQAQAGPATQLFNFSSYVDIENSVLRPNGHLLFTTLTSPQLYSIDPSASEPTAEVVHYFTGATALTGIAEIGDDKFAVIGGDRGSYNYTDETIFTIDFSAATEENPNATVVETAAKLPNAIMLNGMAALPSNPHVLIIGDSRVGCLWRVDLDAGTVAQAITDESMAAPANSTTPIGIDGLKISADGAYAYFTNVARLMIARIPISDDETTLSATGDVEVITYFEDDWDDFALNGTIAYGAQNPSQVARLDLETGELTILVNDTIIAGGPTSVVLKGDGVHAYVTSRGDSSTGASGQVLEVAL